MKWTQALYERGAGEVIAIDGKTVRRSHDRRPGRGPLHMVRAWATEAGLALGQVATEVKSNEIVAPPVLLGYLELQGAIVTIDAMGCQRDIAAQIIEQGGDYVLAVKGHQAGLHDSLVELLPPRVRMTFGVWCKRITRRPIAVMVALKCAAGGRVCTWRFREDASRIRRGHGAENFSTLRHFALNLVKRHAPKRSVRKDRIGSDPASALTSASNSLQGRKFTQQSGTWTTISYKKQLAQTAIPAIDCCHSWRRRSKCGGSGESSTRLTKSSIKLLWLALLNVLNKSVRSAFDWKSAMNQHSHALRGSIYTGRDLTRQTKRLNRLAHQHSATPLKQFC